MRSGKQFKERSRGSLVPWLVSSLFSPPESSTKVWFCKAPFWVSALTQSWSWRDFCSCWPIVGKCSDGRGVCCWWVHKSQFQGSGSTRTAFTVLSTPPTDPRASTNPWQEEVCLWPLRSWEGCMSLFLDEFHPYSKIKSWYKKKSIIIHLHDSLSQPNSAWNEEQHSFQA